MLSFQKGVVVPIPREPVKKDVADVVAMRLPTVSCVPVAVSCPELFEVMIELAAYVPVLVMKPESLLNHDSLTDDDAMVLTCPELPVYAKPCASDGR